LLVFGLSAFEILERCLRLKHIRLDSDDSLPIFCEEVCDAAYTAS
jgi:hypothetical protein